MGSKHLNRSIIPKVAKENKIPKYIRKDEAIMSGWKIDGEHANVFVSLRFIQEKHECFSDWDKNDMTSFWNFNRKIHGYTWAQILSTSGKTDKNGFAYTLLPSSKYPNQDFIKDLDPETSFFELRVTQKGRIHGFRDKSVLYICWLDRNHKICP